jgi:hypothetical protein
VLERLKSTSRWLHLIAGWLAEQGADVEDIGLLEAARADIDKVCERLAGTASR